MYIYIYMHQCSAMRRHLMHPPKSDSIWAWPEITLPASGFYYVFIRA